MLTQPLALQRQPEQEASTVAVPLTFAEFGQGDSPWCTISFHCNGDVLGLARRTANKSRKHRHFTSIFVDEAEDLVVLAHLRPAQEQARADC